MSINNLPQFFISYWENFTQSYLSLLNLFLFLSTFSVLLSSSASITIFPEWLAYKSLHSVLINCTMWSSYLSSSSSCFPRCSWSRFFRSSFFRVQLFQSPGFLGSSFFRVQLFQSPGFLGSSFFRVQVLLGPVPGSGTSF